MALAAVGFTDTAKAARLWEEPALAPLVRADVLADFAVAADPDLALLMLSRLAAAADGDFTRQLADDPSRRARRCGSWG